MKQSEFIKYRRLINKELEKRKEIEKLIKEKSVDDLLKLTGLNLDSYRLSNIDGIIDKVLSSFTIKETNGIYVCVDAYFEDWQVCYEETTITNVYVKINSPEAEYRIYRNIEDESVVMAAKASFVNSKYPLFSDFEKDNIVFNPHNSKKGNNGYDEVSRFFFRSCIDNSQNKAKKLLLERFPRL